MPAPYTSLNIITGNSWNDTIHGTAGADGIYGYGGNDIIYGYEGDDYLNGGLGNDWLFGGLGDDTFDGGAGNNIFFGNRGNDTVTYRSSQYGVHINLAFGETTNQSNSAQDDLYNIENAIGSDYEDYIQGDEDINSLFGGFSDDVLNGWGGNDILDGGYHDDLLIGAEGDDTFIGGHGADRMFGGNGNDTVDYSASNFGISMAFTSGAGGGGNAAGDSYFNIENIIGSQGHDLLEGDANANRFIGNDGEDILVGRGGADHLDGGNGNDTLWGVDQNDMLIGGGGADYINGGNGIDTISFGYLTSAIGVTLPGITIDLAATTFSGRGTDGSRVFETENVIGSADADKIYGSSGANSLNGAAGNDQIDGRSGNDVVSGGYGADTVRGGNGNDTVNGDFAFASLSFLVGGNDRLYGNDGDDFIYGGFGRDTMTGGSGQDKFAYTSTTNSGTTATTRDFITDFNDDWDVIALNGIDARAGTAANDAFTFIGRNSFTGVAGQLRYGYEDGDTIISGDTNGDGTADFQIELDDYISLRATDFIL